MFRDMFRSRPTSLQDYKWNPQETDRPMGQSSFFKGSVKGSVKE